MNNYDKLIQFDKENILNLFIEKTKYYFDSQVEITASDPRNLAFSDSRKPMISFDFERQIPPDSDYRIRWYPTVGNHRIQ